MKSVMNDLVQRPDALPVVGTRKQWAFDAALVGTVAGGASTLLLAQMLAMGMHGVVISAVLAAAGGVSGLLLGIPLRAVVDRLRGRLPMWGYFVAMPIVGAAWGTLALSLASIVANGGIDPSALWLTFRMGGPFGAALFGLLWLPYAMATVLRWRRWPVVVATAVLSPVIATVVWWAIALL